MLINVTNHINVISKKDISIQNSKIKPISLNEDLYLIYKIENVTLVNSSREVWENKSKFNKSIITNKTEYNNIKEYNELETISDHIFTHIRPNTNEELGYYLAGLIEGDGYFGEQRFEIAFHENDTFFIGYGSVLNLKNKSQLDMF